MAHYRSGLYVNIETGKVTETPCAGCFDSLLKAWKESGKGVAKEMADKVVKIPDELYRKVKAKADTNGISMAKALDTIVEGKPMSEDIEAFVPSCAEEAGIKMPKDYRWIQALSDVLPAGLRGKLEPYAKCLECAEAKAQLRKLAEDHLDEITEVTEVAEAETEEV
ncbi:unnamed protein product [marine sediment metagenome]|uniref:Uncharacterized protein n=1 Tax=marine sediment metagenome TaxID=412755 RepID=X1JJD9_9ZZZZ